MDNKVYISLLRHATRNGMGAEEGAHNLQRSRFLNPAYHAKHLQFVLNRKSVTALYLHHAGTFLYYLMHSRHRLFIEFLLRKVVKTVGTI